jgi:hypothetical protein
MRTMVHNCAPENPFLLTRRRRGRFRLRPRPGMTLKIRPRLLAARFRPSFENQSPQKIRGRRENRVPVAPIALRAKIKNTQVSPPQVHRKSPRPSLREWFNGFLCGLPGDRAFLPPSPTRCVSIAVDLTPASRHQDATTSPSVATSFVFSTSPRPPHPAPNVRDDREAPLFFGNETREVLKMICPTRQAKCLRHDGTTGKSVRHSGALRQHRAMVRNCAPENPSLKTTSGETDSRLAFQAPRNDG